MNAIPSPRRALPGAIGAAGTTMIGEVVLRAGEETLLVEAGSARLPARRAVSCLVEPEPGDLVLLGGGAERPYILAVLERRSTAPLRLAVQGDLEIAATAGRLALRGETGAEVASPAAVTITAGDELTVTGRRARLLLDEVVHVGRSLAAHIGSLKVVGEALETLMGRILSRARRSYRFVEEGDHLRSGTIDHRAEGTLHLRGANALVTASTIAKVDAGQIHLG
ncbi:MAG: DUF3540 domain-containing protein [Acetobacteraceae bacterium]|nr:DUF3540 domain-containing protein [Acetobacteraceae bacterium]